MRRISLALALMGAVAAAGCGGGAKPSSNSGNQGTAGVNFTVTVNNQGPGTVVSVPAGINCAASTLCVATFNAGTTVVLTATATGGNYFNGWYGGCEGTETCTLTGQADKYVVSYFSATAQAHGNWSHGWQHGPRYEAFVAGVAGELQCTNCHGAGLIGTGIAPACNTCHYFNGKPSVIPSAPSAQVMHFKATAEAWGDHNGWSQACQRCHTNQGFNDFIGVDGTPNLDAVYPAALQSDNTLVATTAACVAAGTCTAGAYAYGPLKCDTCHGTTQARGLATITFPSGKKVTPADHATALCGQCHGARESTASVNAKVGVTTADTAISPAQGFINPHYLGAAATLFGADAQGWAQYPGMVYTAANKHGGLQSCTACHNAHNGELPADGADIQRECGKCHFDELTNLPVKSFVELEESRQFGFEGDIDGDGAQKSLKLEIDGLAAKVYAAIQAYALNVVGTPIVYSDAYPYFLDATKTTATGYPKIMTPRLLRATFNYKWYKADPGAWAHNPRYAIEVLYDALFDLNAGLKAAGKATIDVTGVRRSFDGHFGSAGFAAEPYAQWLYHPAAGSPYGTPGPGFSGNTCYQCHGGNGGFGAYVTGSPVAKPATSDCIGNAPCAVATGGQPDPVLTPGTYKTFQNRVTGLQCATCHVDAADMKGIRSDIATLYVPPQKGAVGTNGVVSFAAADLPAGFTVCATCHTGLENMASVDTKIATTAETQAIGFVNGHYYGAAGIILGSDAKVLYEYPSKTYQGKAVNFVAGSAEGPHGSPHGARCTGCHDPRGSKHSFEIDTATTVVKGTYHGVANTKTCDECHIDATAFGAGDYRLAPPKAKLQQLGADLLAAIQAYASTRTGALKNDGTTLANPYYFAPGTGAGICYSAAVYPYFIRHGAATGDCTTQELTNAGAYQVRSNGYAFDAKLLKAAYNYQWFVKDPGAAEHNFIYVAQVLFDSIEDLGGTTTVARP